MKIDIFCLENWDIIFIIILLLVMFTLSAPDPSTFYRISISIFDTALMMIGIKGSQCLAKNHAHSVREVAKKFSSVFCIITISGIYLWFSNSLDSKSNPTDKIGRLYFFIISNEMNILDGLKIVFRIFTNLISIDILYLILCKITKSRPPPSRSDLISTYLVFGLYRISYQRNDGLGTTSTFRFSFPPTKLLTILVMKCFCSATATYASINLILLVFYPNIANNQHLTPAKSCQIVALFGCHTVLAAFIDSQSPNLIYNAAALFRNFLGGNAERIG